MFPKRHLMRAYEGRMEPLDFEKFCAELMSKGAFEICRVGDLVLDRVPATMIALALAPCALSANNQALRPTANGRIAFSARILLMCRSPRTQ